MASEKIYTEAEVAEHNTAGDCWIILGNASNGGAKVVDVSKYLNDHPGGPEIVLEYAGKNADDMFEDIGHSSEARSILKKYIIGSLKVDESAASTKKEKKVLADLEKSRGGLNPLAVVVLLVAIAAGIYYTQLTK